MLSFKHKKNFLNHKFKEDFQKFFDLILQQQQKSG